MNYIEIINLYWKLREQGILDAGCGDLYLYLVHKSNSLGWKNEGAVFSVGGLTYIEEKMMERKLKRSLSSELTGRECWWGRVCELRAFEV